MQFGTKLKLKKDWKLNNIVTLEKGDTLQVVKYMHKHRMKLYFDGVANLINFEFNYSNRDEKIEEYFEIVEEFDDRFAELKSLQNENKTLIKTLEKYNEEMIDLRKENQDLKNSNNELLEGLKSTQKRLEEWLEKCK